MVCIAIPLALAFESHKGALCGVKAHSCALNKNASKLLAFTCLKKSAISLLELNANPIAPKAVVVRVSSAILSICGRFY